MADDSSLSDEEPMTPADPGAPLLDRSRARLRLPADLLNEALELAEIESMVPVEPRSSSQAKGAKGAEAAGRLANLMVGKQLDPIAAEVLQVVNKASLMVAVDLSYGPDSSAATIWATPRQAAVSNPIDPAQVELELSPVNQLPQILAQLVVLRSPDWVGDGAMSVGVETLSEALGKSSRDEAIQVLAGDGLDTEQALLILDLQLPEIRRWRISSSWSTEHDPEGAELRGLDAGPSGQWLESTTPGENGQQGLRTFTPLGHGEGMSALRAVLPRNWMGIPLKRRST